MDTKLQLRRLLQSAGDESSRKCLMALSDASRNYRESSHLPADQIRSTYGVRAGINARNGSPIGGFDELIWGLSAYSEPYVMIHSVGTPPAELFLVFTDVSVTKIVGILHIPPKTSHEHEQQAVAIAAS